MLRFTPLYQPMTWGGRRLADELGRVIPEGPIGESWELVDFDGKSSTVEGGEATLGELWRSGALGGSGEGGFPFLLKWLDTSAWLSVQVHPDEAAVAAQQKGAPKTEAWYVARSDEKATLLAGHYPGLDATLLRQAAARGTITKWLYESHPRPGDMILVRAGTLHAIGPGLLILEVQQPSSSTYRVYDWGRTGLDGKPRELHLDAAAAVTRYERHGALKAERQVVVGPRFEMRAVKAGAAIPPGPLRVIVAAPGPSTLEHEGGELNLRFGDVVVAEPKDGTLYTGTACVLLSEPGGTVVR